MANQTIRVVARLVALPEKVDELKSVLLGIIEPTRKEAGCIKYELLQNNADPADFTFVEEWESDALLDTHLGSEHIQKAIEKLDGLVAVTPDIRRYSLLA
ncbi:putative quinol monooxygenase [Aerosakkonema funiforme]|uniref:Antibiotic biosynthesis monooxygenase n=1 Tax=Aerosakkonema funiforme FACHB-1375 TaxID=2949571 RepID=A0A926VGP2_9CYAN|nr:putative quinol monooxygenase [Aerosakkonema funiforme]MBD2183452.1 antibiotic biosynthesis monooxygenase [Aerosakkonema funiforme FACHB-1375]